MPRKSLGSGFYLNHTEILAILGLSYVACAPILEGLSGTDTEMSQIGDARTVKMIFPNMLTGQAIYQAINAVRVAHHEKALSPDACLVREANRRAKEIALKFAHTGKRFCGRSVSGENLSKGYKTTESVTGAWMRSKTHKDNLLDSDYKRTGIGIYEKDGVTYITQLFSN